MARISKNAKQNPAPKKEILQIGRGRYWAEEKDGVYAIANLPYARLPLTPEGHIHAFGPPHLLRNPDDGDIRNLKRQAPVCLQYHEKRFPMSPQCQYLNIWLSKQVLESKEPAPVLFYVHGGSFMNGSNMDSEVNGENLARAMNIIVVIPSYRIGPLGFLDFHDLDPSCTGNNAFRDLLTALQWVREQISAFGGDPDNITIMGESSGGTLVSAFPFLAGSRGLFDKMIIYSGIPTSFISRQESSLRAKGFADFLHFNRLEDFCKKENWPKIARAVKLFNVYSRLGASAYQPCVDEDLLEGNPVYMARQHVKNGAEIPYPVWFNSCRDEMAFMVSHPAYANYSFFIHDLLSAGAARETSDWLTAEGALYQKHYPGRSAKCQLYSDIFICTGLLWYAEFISHWQKTYFTRLDWESPISKAGGLGAFHTSDIHILFDSPVVVGMSRFFHGKKVEPAMHKVRDVMRRDLDSFMRRGYLMNTTMNGPLAPFSPDDCLVKCYDLTQSMALYMPFDIQELWKKGNYYRNVSQTSVWTNDED